MLYSEIIKKNRLNILHLSPFFPFVHLIFTLYKAMHPLHLNNLNLNILHLTLSNMSLCTTGKSLCCVVSGDPSILRLNILHLHSLTMFRDEKLPRFPLPPWQTQVPQILLFTDPPGSHNTLKSTYILALTSLTGSLKPSQTSPNPLSTFLAASGGTAARWALTPCALSQVKAALGHHLHR